MDGLAGRDQRKARRARAHQRESWSKAHLVLGRKPHRYSVTVALVVAPEVVCAAQQSRRVRAGGRLRARKQADTRGACSLSKRQTGGAEGGEQREQRNWQHDAEICAAAIISAAARTTAARPLGREMLRGPHDKISALTCHTPLTADAAPRRWSRSTRRRTRRSCAAARHGPWSCLPPVRVALTNHILPTA